MEYRMRPKTRRHLETVRKHKWLHAILYYASLLSFSINAWKLLRFSFDMFLRLNKYHICDCGAVCDTGSFLHRGFFKRSRQHISRIENQRQKIKFFFILPKHPFLWTSFEKNIFKFQRFSFWLKSKKVWKLVKITVFPLPKRSNRHATLERCWPRLTRPFTMKLCTVIIILLHIQSI